MEWHETAASVGRGVCIRGSLRLAGGGAVVWPARAAPPRLPPRFAPPTAACVLCGHRWPAVFHTVGLGGDGRAGPEPFSLCRATPIAAGSAHLPPPWLGRPDKRRIHATWRILVLVVAIVCRTVSLETLEPGEHPASSPEQPGFDLAIDASAAASRRPSPHLPLGQPLQRPETPRGAAWERHPQSSNRPVATALLLNGAPVLSSSEVSTPVMGSPLSIPPRWSPHVSPVPVFARVQ